MHINQKQKSDHPVPMLNNDQQVHVHAIPHPFSVERIDRYLPSGLTIDEIISEVQTDPLLRQYVHVFIDGDYIPQDRWMSIKPKPHAVVSLRMVPQGGGGGKNPLRTILSVALLAAAPQLGGLLSTALGAQLGGVFSLSLTQRLVAGGLNFLGNLALNALAPPSRPRIETPASTSRTQFIQGARNRAEPFENIPQVLGQHRMVPPLGARPFTETVGNDQFVRMLFVWGFGPLDISDLRIGETPINEFEEVEIETRTGGEDDAPLSLYSETVLQNDLQVLLTRTAGAQVRTTDVDVDEISVDITFPNGLIFFRDDGSRAARTVQVEVQYAPTGTQDWSAGATVFQDIAEQVLSEIQTPGIQSLLPGQNSADFNLYKRIDSIVISNTSGKAEVIQGDRVLGFDQNGNPQSSQVIEPIAPIVPGDSIEIARVTQLGDIIGFAVEDVRNPALFEDVFENENDFIVSVNMGTITVGAGGLRFDGFIVQARQSNAIRRSLRFRVPRGQYDVRLRRVSADTNNDNIFDDVFWNALRGIRHENPVRVDGLAVTALRIRATDQLNGTIDQFNGIVTSIVPDWNGIEWVEQPTSNPASLFRHVLQGPGNARPLADERLDLDKLSFWHQRCAEAEREFNSVIPSGQSVMDVLNDIAAAGRASPNIIDGRWGVVEDLLQTVPVQHFTPRNSSGFEAERSFESYPHGLRIRFNNRDSGWQLDERIVFDDGFDETNATEFEGLELSGITSAEQIWRDGRYHIASARLRPETYSFNTDIEHIVCTRGDLIRLTHDVALVGLASARIKSVTETGGAISSITLDAEIEMEAGITYVVRIRTQTGHSIVKTLVTIPGRTQDLKFEIPHSPVSDINVDDLVLFGEQGLESVELIVKSIEPQDDLSARITCVDAAPLIHQADVGLIPDFDSQITIPPELRRPDVPEVQTIQSGAEVLRVNTDGSFTPQIVVNFVPSTSVDDLTLRVRIREKDESFFRIANITQVGDFEYIINDVEEGVFYDLEFKYIRSNNIASSTLLLSGYEVIGAQGIPQDVTDFAVNIIDSTAHLSWAAASDIDISHYRLKFSSDLSQNAIWENAQDLIEVIPGSSVQATVPAMSGRYFIKAVDLGGRESENAAIIQTTVPDILSQNIIATLTEHPVFSGEVQHVALVEGALRLTGADSIDDFSDFDDVENIDIGLSGYAIKGIYDFQSPFDLGAVYTSRLCADISAIGLDLYNTIDIRPNIDLTEDWDGESNPQNWSAMLQVQTTDDDPNDQNAIWTEWQNFIIGDYTARAFMFRLVLSTQQEGVTPKVDKLTVMIDMPDRLVSDQDISSAIGGTVINFTNPFREKPAIAISGQSLQTGDRFELSAITRSGFTVTFFDQNNQAVSRSFDYFARGFGQEQ